MKKTDKKMVCIVPESESHILKSALANREQLFKLLEQGKISSLAFKMMPREEAGRMLVERLSKR